MRSTATGASLALSLAYTGFTVALVPEWLEITENTSSGNGCPPGSVVTTASQDDLQTLYADGTKADMVSSP
jgi:hypothetical protein